MPSRIILYNPESKIKRRLWRLDDEVGLGDFVYFAPYVPHQERNLDADESLDFVVVSSNHEGVAVNLDVIPVEQPEAVF